MFWKLHHKRAQKNVATNHAKIWMEIHAPHSCLGHQQNFAGATNKNPNPFHFEMGPKRIDTLLSTLQLTRAHTYIYTHTHTLT
jgi:hypothetical protein